MERVKSGDEQSVFDSSGVLALLNNISSDSERYESKSDEEAEKDSEAVGDLATSWPPESVDSAPPELQMVSQWLFNLAINF